MKALVIGGTRFIGHHAVERLLEEGHEVTLFHRGETPSAFAGSVREILGDRTKPGAWGVLPDGEDWDLALDLCAYRGADSESAAAALRGRVGRFVHISTGQVYLVLDPRPSPAREYDYEGPTMPEPPPGPDREEWRYGMDKRECESRLREAFEGGLATTVLRLPVVEGPRDPKRRLEPYARRILAGEPVTLLEGDRSRPVRHLFVKDVAACVAGLLGTRRGFGRAFNLSMDEPDVTLSALVEELGRALGKPARIEWAFEAELKARGLQAADVSPLSGRWSSLLDPARAIEELGFQPTPWRSWLAETARSLKH